MDIKESKELRELHNAIYKYITEHSWDTDNNDKYHFHSTIALFYTSWGEMHAGKFYKFLPLEKELSSCEIQFFTSNWVELKEEKSTLRAVVNGKVIGVPEDFYDHLIRKEIPDGEFIMARLIGKILGKYPLGVGDWWYAKRINKMIEDGELMVVQKKKETYSQVLKKV